MTISAQYLSDILHGKNTTGMPLTLQSQTNVLLLPLGSDKLMVGLLQTKKFYDGLECFCLSLRLSSFACIDCRMEHMLLCPCL